MEYTSPRFVIYVNVICAFNAEEVYIYFEGKFLERHLADDILFGNTFDRSLQLPWGSGAALKFMKYVYPISLSTGSRN